MVTTSITLTEQEETAIRTIAQQTGKTPDELLREAVEQLLVQYQQTYRRALLQQARGMWRDRADLPPLETLRREFDRAGA
jgi:lipase chaperone LimK